MGYYTKYTLIFKAIPEIEKAVIEFLEENEDYCGIAEHSQEAKWYEWKPDMFALSKMFPGVLFTLEGVGEEDDDHWKAYFYNGKCQHETAEIKIAPFDFNKLKAEGER